MTRGWCLLALLAAARPALAHHGVASAGFAGAEGPGAGLEVTAAFPIPQRAVVFLSKEEYARFRHLAHAEPTNKDHFSFTTVGAGVGIRPWLSAYLFAQYAVKAQDGVGTSAGFADPSVLLAVGFKWDEGLRLVPEKESLDELADWHFSVWAGATAPLGSVSRRDARGELFEPEMQSGFGAPSLTAGAAVAKQVSDRLTLLGDASHQRFFPHGYDFTRYQFGAETRAGAAVSWRVRGTEGFRLDVVGELTGIRLERDRERGPDGLLEPLRASGGSILYGGAGVRVGVGPLGVAVGVRRAALSSLNERTEQQGSEGLEAYRTTAALTWTAGI